MKSDAKNVNLIDADMIQYSVGWSIGDGELEDAYHKVDDFISWITEQTGCPDSRLFIAGEGNYRKDIMPEYKANRKGKPKPKHHKAIRDYLINNWDAYVVTGEEVDDKLGYTQSDDTIICSGDKDLDCIPGKHFNWSKKYVDKGVYELSEVDADRFFYLQCLSGDPTDGIPGLKRLTGRTATKKLKEPLLSMDNQIDMHDYVHGLYDGVDWYPSANCLWIRRKPYQIWEDMIREIKDNK
jgi:hypothetical protein